MSLILADGCTLTASQGVNVPSGSLTIYGQAGGDGALIATAGGDADGNGGNINDGSGPVAIHGGAVTAQGGSNGAGIGAGVGGGKNGAGEPGVSTGFSTGGGSALIDASSIRDTSGQDSWSGIIFQGSEGAVYGDTTLTEDFEIPAGKTLTVPEGVTLTVSDGVTLTNQGTLRGGGALTNSGTLSGSISGTGSFTTEPTADMISVNTDGLYASEADLSEDMKGRVSLPGTVEIGGQTFTVDQSGWTPSVTKVSDTEYTVRCTKGGKTISRTVTITANFKNISSGGGSSGGGSSGGSSGGGSSARPTYPPTVVQPGEGGGVTVSTSRPERGDKVTVKPKPEDGYEVAGITVTDQNGKPVEVRANSDGTYSFVQPSGKVKIEVSYKPVEPVETEWSNPFTDISQNDWYYDAVRYVQENGLMGGYGSGLFGPNDTLSRAQLAQILYNKEGRPNISGGSAFDDVDSGAWCAGAITWVAQNGIAGGYGDGMFGPNDPITREQLAVMLWRYAGSPAATNKELHFNDTDEISGYTLNALRWAVENGILNGYGDGRLGPKGQATRAQAAQMLKNYLER